MPLNELSKSAPEQVSLAATELWRIAINHARAQDVATVTAERGDLVRAQTTLAVERARLQDQFEQLAASVEVAKQARKLAETRVQDLQRLVDQQSVQLADLQQRHEAALASHSKSSEKLEATRATLTAVQEKAINERAVLETAHRAAEDRWLREVDRARQDEIKVAAQLQQVERISEAATQNAAKQMTELTDQLRLHERECAAKSAHLAALETQLDRLHAQLKERLVRPTAKKVAKPRKNTS